MIPPLKPSYIFLLKYNNKSLNSNLDDEALILPEIILKSKKCRFMIHILAINYKGKHKEQFEKQIQNFIKKDFWINYNFLNASIDSNKDPETLLSQYALFKTPQILHEYVERTFLAINEIPNNNCLCNVEENSLELNDDRSLYNFNNNIFGIDFGFDLNQNDNFNVNHSYNQRVETSGMTTTSTSKTYSSINTNNKLLWCIEILNNFYYLNLNILRMEKKRFERDFQINHINPQEIFNSECYKIYPHNNNNNNNNDSFEYNDLDQQGEIEIESKDETNTNDNIHKITNIIKNNNENVHIQNKLFF